MNSLFGIGDRAGHRSTRSGTRTGLCADFGTLEWNLAGRLQVGVDRLVQLRELLRSGMRPLLVTDDLGRDVVLDGFVLLANAPCELSMTLR